MSYFKGYVNIYARGYFLERFLNLCVREDILLWDLERQTPSEMRAKVSISAFKDLRVAARRTRTKIKVTSKYGFPFFLRRNRRRRGMAVGLFLFAVIIWYLSTHLMGITITGNAALPDEKIYAALNSYGIKIGTPVKNIDNQILKNQLMTALEDIGWAGVNLKGSRLYIEVRGREKKETSVSEGEPCNIVAAKDGIVRLMEIRDGQTMVYVDTLVEKGDLLVSGVIDSNVTGMRYVHSYGEVYASTWYSESMDIPLSCVETKMTGNRKRKYDVSLLNCSFKLYFRPTPKYEKYQSHRTVSEYSLPLKIFPSVFVGKTEFYEQTELNRTRTVEEAVALGRFYLCHRINTQLAKGAEVENVKLSYEENGDSVRVTVEYECLENIAEQTPIDKSEILEYNNINNSTEEVN